MALNNIQERIERSYFKAIEAVLVSEGYLPTNPSSFENTPNGQSLWEAALKTITQSKGFAIEVFGAGTSQSFGQKNVPRIEIQSGRIMPGDIGTSGDLGFKVSQNNPDKFVKNLVDYQSTHLGVDIVIIAGKISQERILNAIIAKAIGTKKHIVTFDDPTDRFFSVQYNFYDNPDATEGLIEKTYSYEVKDIFLYNEDSQKEIAPINKITVEIENEESDLELLPE